MENYVGKTFGLLTILEEVEKAKKQRRMLVQCSCKEANKKIVHLSHLKTGHTGSCGCARFKTHGFGAHYLYGTWHHMHQRCKNPKTKQYSDYGGRGITVCERWNSIANFMEDMLPTHVKGLTLDRIDNDKGYSPENCKWSTHIEQRRNMRKNINITIEGRTQCLTAWCLELDVNYFMVNQRIRTGKDPVQALLHKKRWGLT
jgi:hypothetical protein